MKKLSLFICFLLFIMWTSSVFADVFFPESERGMSVTEINNIYVLGGIVIIVILSIGGLIYMRRKNRDV